MELTGKRALVTGGAVRIGRAIAETLIAEDVEVIVHFRTSEKKADVFWPNIIQSDLSDPAQCETLIARAVESFGPIDILINNAAVFHQQPLADATHEAMMAELQPNLFAPLALIRGFAKQGISGKIINLLDQRVASHDIRCVPYMLSKKGLEELTKLAALDLAPGITVNAVAPGAVLPPPQDVDNPVWEAAGTIPLEKRPATKDIADAVVYLLKADSVTGQTLFIDGGQNLLGN
ncbi:MAG: SDR family oxidoreductase [Verrucomicrobia bacterium]|nr:SDR family oxidoreductase [Verrucomicrobiota bacterium]